MKKNAPHIPDILHIRDPEAWGGMKGRLFAFLQTVYQIVSSFTAHQGTLRAAALTYTTILSLIPLLAIAFSVLKGLGAQNALEPLLQQVAGDSKETISRIISYVNNTNVKSLGAVGLLVLVLTVISLLEQVESSFNATWGVQQNRPLQRRFSDYLSVVVVGPILLLAATSMTTSLQSQWLVQWLIEHTYLGDTILLLFRMVPYLFIWLAMTFLYIFIPNTKVRLGSAALGGVLAGTAWQIAQWGYFYFQVGMANYNAIYGTLAALPIFLVWVYTSWVIVLFGLEVVYAHQNRAASAELLRSIELTAAAREVLALSSLLLVCSHFRDDAPPPATAQLSNELGIPLFEAEELMASLRDLHFLARVGENGSGWLPARDPSAITLDEVLTALRGKVPSEEECATSCRTAIEVLGRESHMRRESLKGVTILDVMKKLILVVLLASTVAQAETYKWTDKVGTVHFSESHGDIPAEYRNSARHLEMDTSNTANKNRAGSFAEHRQGVDADGAIAPEVEDLKERMLKDEGIMALIRTMQNDPEMQALLADPAIISAVQAGDIAILMNNPVFLKLLKNPRVQEIEKRMQHGGTR